MSDKMISGIITGVLTASIYLFAHYMGEESEKARAIEAKVAHYILDASGNKVFVYGVK